MAVFILAWGGLQRTAQPQIKAYRPLRLYLDWQRSSGCRPPRAATAVTAVTAVNGRNHSPQ